MKVDLLSIVIKKRVREDLGDMAKLKDSLVSVGLINPIILNDDLELLAGYRRYTAANELGWENIECRIISTESELEKFMIEADENIIRKEFTHDELIKINKKIDELKMNKIMKILKKISQFFNKIFNFIKGLFSKK
jgi:ParB family transcriptional regulator, chromosome partitioning protein